MFTPDASTVYLSDFPDKTIALVGMMGVGKTTLGRRLAQAIGWPFFDVDAEIEEAAGMPVADLFEQYGEEAFRKGERRVIRRLLKGPRHVLATGGGAFANDKTRDLLKRRAVTVWLRADLETIVERTSLRDTRPLLRGGDARAKIESLLTAREPAYANADLVVDSVDGPHKNTIRVLLDRLEDYRATLAPEEPDARNS